MCQACGLCCNGTFYNYVTTVPDDLPKLKKYPQLILKVRNEQETFDEPCVLHDGKGCTAYEDRPGTCARYFCRVMRLVGRNELTEDEALLIIQEARALVDIVQEYVTFEPGLPMAVSTWDEPPEGIGEEARLAWERTMYHLGKHFLGTVNEEVEVPARLLGVDDDGGAGGVEGSERKGRGSAPSRGAPAGPRAPQWSRSY